MKNKGITFFLILLAIVIGVVMVAEFISTRPDHQEANPYALNTDSLKEVDPAYILYRETRNLKLNFEKPVAISVTEGKLVVAGDNKVSIIDMSGKLLAEAYPDVAPRCLKATKEKIFVGAAQKIVVLDSLGNILETMENFSDSTLLTSLDFFEGKLYAADAGKRLVYRLNEKGEKEVEIAGKRGESDHHGFIIPSPYFDLAFNAYGELWIANTGMYSLENYTIDGKLNGYWEAPTSGLSGYSGCCNPAHFTFLPDGNFITSEKAITRIKIYKPSGELVGVVAPPSSFDTDGHALDVACDSQGRIYALDTDRKMIRVFEKNQP